ncbi:LuxR C-terminal-related transcriptional regulator [Streptomyces sp. NPDC093109]|uniref:LuxR C-terminal-related transcriptional regulator n=1 Tax=Streptomyces sp. NPDC093109 TaxID=3154977 RepID=UPI00344F9648
MNTNESPGTVPRPPARCCAFHEESLLRAEARIDKALASLEGARDLLAGLRLMMADLGTGCTTPQTRRQSPRGEPARWQAPGLTAKETEVVTLLAEGMTNKSIARSLAVSERTVKNHLRSVFVKLGATSRTEVALLVVRGAMGTPLPGPG